MKHLLIKTINSTSALCIFIILVTLAMILIGCTERPPLDRIPLTPTENILKAMQDTNWLITIGILGIGLSVFAMFQGWKQAVPTMLGFIAVLVLALTVARYGIVIGFGGLVLLFGYICYHLFVRGRALKEIIENVENVKDTFRGNANTRVQITSELRRQSPSTTKIVSAIKGVKNES